MTKVLYPGSFDPMTKGHMNIVEQASDLFDEVIIAVMQNPLKKSGLFTLEERMEIIKELYQRMNNVKIISGSGSTVDIYSRMEEYEDNLAIEALNRMYFDKIINLYKKSKKIIDMHTHTNYSDGDLSSQELIKLAIDKRIRTLAITDYDNLLIFKSL